MSMETRTKKIYCGTGHVFDIGQVGTLSVTNITPNTQPPNSIEFDVHLPDSCFTGRDEKLQHLDNALQRNLSSIGNVESLITVVTGLGGIGKTQLVKEYVRLNKLKYSNNVIWINAEKEEMIVEAFKRLAKDNLRISTMDANGHEQGINSVVQSVYYYFCEKNVLFIFDNVESMASIRNYLILLNLSSNVATRPYIIFTTRVQEWCAGIEVIQLDEWPEDEGAKFVLKTLGDAVDNVDDVKLLIEELQCFPLALRQATSYIINQRVTDKFTISNYLSEYKRQKKELLDSKLFQDQVSKYTETTFTTWNITIRTIGQDREYGSLALKILNTIAYFYPENIHRAWLIDLVNDPKESTFSLLGKCFIQSVGSVFSEVLNVPNVGKSQFRAQKKLVDSEKLLKSAVRLLVKYSMISGQDKQSILNIHRVVQDVIRHTIKSNCKEERVLRDVLSLIGKIMKRFHLSHTLNVVFAIQYTLLYPSLHKETSQLLNINLINLITDHWFQVAVAFGNGSMGICEFILKTNPYLLEQIKLNLTFAKIYGEGSFFLIRNDSLYLMYDEVYKMRLNEFGEKDKDTIKAKLITGYILMYMRKSGDAITIFEDVLHKYKEINNEELEIETLRRIGNTYDSCRLYEESLEKRKTLYNKMKSKFGEKHLTTLQTLNNMGTTLYHLGKYTEALDVFNKILENRKEIGEETNVILNAIENIGLINSNLGNYEKSIEIYKKVHAKSTKLLGKKHPATLRAFNGIGTSLLRQGKNTDALYVFIELFDNCSELEVNSEVILNAMNNLGSIYCVLGNYEESLEIHEKVHKLRTELLGENHPDTLASLNGIGRTLLEQGNYTDALNIFNKIYESLLEEEKVSDGVLLAMRNIGLAHFKLGNYEKSLEIRKAGHAKRIKVFGKTHSETLRELNFIGYTLLRQSRYSEALHIFQEIFENIGEFGDDNELILLARENAGEVHFKQGNYKESLAIHKNVYAKRMQLLGEYHPDTIRSSNNIGVALLESGKYIDALHIFEQIVEKCVSLGEENESCLIAMFNVGTVQYKLGNCAGSLQMHKKVHEKRIKLLGENHPETLNALNGIALACFGQEKYTDALDIFKEISEKVVELGDDHDVILDALHNLAFVHIKLGNYDESLKILKKVHEKRITLLGENHPHTLRTLHGTVYALLGLEKYTDVLNLLKQKHAEGVELEEDNDVSLAAMHNMGMMHCIEGNFEESLNIFRLVHSKYTKILGESHTTTLFALNNIGVLLKEQGKFTDALHVFREICEKDVKQGEDRECMLLAMENAGLTLSKLGNYDQSVEICKIVHEKRITLLGENHPHTLRALNYIKLSEQGKQEMNGLDVMNIMGSIQMMAGHFEGALETQKKIHAKYSNLLGESHAKTLHASVAVGNTLFKQGNYIDALHVFKEIYDKDVKLDENNKVILDVMEKIAHAQSELGNYDESLEMFKNIHTKRTKLFGENHRDTLNSLYHIGVALLVHENFSDALDVLKDISEKECELGEDNEIIVNAMHNIGLAYAKQRNWHESLEAHKTVYSKRIKLYGENNTATLISLHEIAFALQGQGNYTDALQICKEIYEKITVLGEDNEVIIYAMQNLGKNHLKLGNYDESLTISKDVYAKSTKRFGENHPNTLSISNNIGIALLAQENYTECLQMFENTCKHRSEIGDDNEIILEAMENMGLTHLKLGNYETSLEITRHVHSMYAAHLGDNHADTLRVLKIIEDTLLAQRNSSDLNNLSQ